MNTTITKNNKTFGNIEVEWLAVEPTDPSLQDDARPRVKEIKIRQPWEFDKADMVASREHVAVLLFNRLSINTMSTVRHSVELAPETLVTTFTYRIN